MNLNNASAQGFRAGNGHCERGGSEGERQLLRTKKHRQHRHKESDGVGVPDTARKGRGEMKRDRVERLYSEIQCY